MLLDIFKIQKETAKDLVVITGLLALVDRPLRNSFDWKDVDADNISKISIEQHEKIAKIHKDDDCIYHAIIGNSSVSSALLFSLGRDRAGIRGNADFSGIKEKLEEEIKRLPLRKITDAEEGRRQAFSTVMHKLIDEFKFERNLQNPRIFSLWLLMLALEMDVGVISPNKFAFIDEFRRAFDIEDDVFEDLQERAVSLRNELEKTMSIIIE